MNHRVRALRDAAVVITVTIAGYAAIERPLRGAETRVSAALAGALGRSHFHLVGSTTVLETPFHGEAFLAVVTPACSSAASVASLVGLAYLMRTGRPARRLAAAAAAVAVVFLGNVIRLSGTMAVGLLAGRSALILFHNFAASVFSFAYTLGGFCLMLYLLLPPSGARTPAGTAAVGRPVELA